VGWLAGCGWTWLDSSVNVAWWAGLGERPFAVGILRVCACVTRVCIVDVVGDYRGFELLRKSQRDHIKNWLFAVLLACVDLEIDVEKVRTVRTAE
jgi:hypothetical protein